MIDWNAGPFLARLLVVMIIVSVASIWGIFKI